MVHFLPAKKSLGQHFLRTESVCDVMIDSAKITQDNIVLEIGPGHGVLTKKLLAAAKKVIAIEKDTLLFKELSHTFEKEIARKKLVLIQGDILSLDLRRADLLPHYKVVANIPYYITGNIIEYLLSNDHQPSAITLLVQKEVAERIAKEKKESILSLSVKVYGVPKYIKTVKKGAFVPPPNVDSAVLLIADISKKHLLTKEKELFFFHLLHKGFGQKRKMLVSNLKDELGTKKDAVFDSLDISPTIRAEDLSLTYWLKLLDQLFPHK